MKNKKFLDFLYSETIKRIVQSHDIYGEPGIKTAIIRRLKGIDVIQLHISYDTTCDQPCSDPDILYFINYKESLKLLKKKIIDFIGHDKKLSTEEQTKIALFIFEEFSKKKNDADIIYTIVEFQDIDYFVFL